jgi:hypothetical protein
VKPVIFRNFFMACNFSGNEYQYAQNSVRQDCRRLLYL